MFQFVITPEAERLNVEIDLIGPMTFVPAGRGEYVAERYPATFRLRLPADGTRDRFEFDWGEVRSYARRVPRGLTRRRTVFTTAASMLAVLHFST